MWFRLCCSRGRNSLSLALLKRFGIFKLSILTNQSKQCNFPNPAGSNAVLELSSVRLGHEVYSVPCGECKDSWMVINLKHAPAWGPDKKLWVHNYWEKLGWMEITNKHNKRFICPRCKGGSVAI